MDISDTESIDDRVQTRRDPLPSLATERVGALIRQARVAHALSTAKLAGRAGVSPATISRIERNQQPAVSMAMVDRILGAMDLRLHIETVPLWADVDEIIDEAARLPLAERIQTWPIEFEALVTRFDGIPYLLDGLAAAAVQGVPVVVPEFEIAVPNDDEVLDRLTLLLEDIMARRGDGFEILDPREPGAGYYTCLAGRIRIRLIERYEPLLWVSIDPLPPSVYTLTSIMDRPLPPPLSQAHLAVVPLEEIRACASDAQRVIARVMARRGR
jgi:transcriptional regulator with XRE-family HTH domain